MPKIAKGRHVVTHVGTYKRSGRKGDWMASEHSTQQSRKTWALAQEYSPPERLALRRFSWEVEG